MLVVPVAEVVVTMVLQFARLAEPCKEKWIPGWPETCTTKKPSGVWPMVERVALKRALQPSWTLPTAPPTPSQPIMYCAPGLTGEVSEFRPQVTNLNGVVELVFT